MVDHQIHFGRKFYRDLKTGYWISTDSPRIRAHRWVWMNIHGAIPKGYHIHHKDEDKSNNDIINLELIERSRHLSIHITEEKRAWAREHMARIRPMTKAWHASEQGLHWHRYHADKYNFGKWEPKEYTCAECGKKYESSKRNRAYFCSNNCKSKARRDSGVDDIEAKCLVCGNPFMKNKYSKKKTCGGNCAATFRWSVNTRTLP